MKKKVVWLFDNGHGGIIDGEYVTKGKRSPVWPDGSQLFEGVFNREIVKRLMSLCEDNGVYYYNLVPENEDPWLHTRAHRANELLRTSLEESLDVELVYVSIHGNAGGGTGFEIYTSRGNTKSDIVATIFYDQFKKDLGGDFKLRPDIKDGDPDKEALFTVLTKTYMPAILTENLFFDNYDPDCKFMMSEEGKDKIALFHFRAMLKYMGDSTEEGNTIAYTRPSDCDEFDVTNYEYFKNIKF